jgi:dipeptidyl-peptidase-4
MSLRLSTLVFIIAFGTFLSGAAQEKLLTLEDVSYMNRDIFPGRVSQLQWIGSTDNYAYAKENAIYKVAGKKGTETLLIDMDMLNSALHLNGYDSIKRLPGLDFEMDEACDFRAGDNYYRFLYKDNLLEKINAIPDSAENTDFHKESGNIAYTAGNNLFIAMDGKVTQVTKDIDPGILNGQTVHRVEFGIRKGTFWSADGSKLAFYRKDETMVTDYPLVDVTARVAEVNTTKYPMAGMTSEEVTLGVYDLEKDVTIYMKTGEPADQYLTSVSWAPDGKSIYIGVLNRDQNHLKLNQYNAYTGEFMTTLFEEMNPKYVEPEDHMHFNPNNPDEFIWISEMDGYNHLYLFSKDGSMRKQLTKGEWVVTGFYGYFGDDLVYFSSTMEEPIC